MKSQTAFVICLLMWGTMQTSQGAVTAKYLSHTGKIVAFGKTQNLARAVATPDDNALIQTAPHSSITLVFPQGWLAAPDGTDAPDLRIRIYDPKFPA